MTTAIIQLTLTQTRGGQTIRRTREYNTSVEGVRAMALKEYRDYYRIDGCYFDTLEEAIAHDDSERGTTTAMKIEAKELRARRLNPNFPTYNWTRIATAATRIANCAHSIAGEAQEAEVAPATAPVKKLVIPATLQTITAAVNEIAGLLRGKE